MMSDQERRLAAKIADALAHRLTSEENAYVKGVADGMIFSREIKERTGLYVDSGYMYKILTGQRNAPKIVAAIREILNLPNE